MISPELLRRYPFFGPLNEKQRKAIAMVADEIQMKVKQVIFEECQAADALYLLIEGDIDLTYKSEEEFYPKKTKVFSVGEINPQEVFAISALIEPYEYNATATVTKDGRAIKIDAKALRELIEQDVQLGYILMHQIAKTAMERLAYTRVQLAAAWA
ncbi:MAG: Crp/Fnr family transcriptional regulator [Anaerolineales bacterium]|jgi:CRP-like cAMP-binding protein|nr:Crp/Fnr family transcriptional regulator [Anaerolineales bacterium]